MKRLLPIALAFLLVGTNFGQLPDRWRGLIIDESTPENAKEVLGPPKSDKIDRQFLMNPKWLTKNADRSLRILKYENVEGFEHVRLGFDQNNKLVLIHLEPKKISAQAFVGSYEGMSFRFANEVMSPADLDSPRDNLEKPKKLGSWYVLVGATKTVFVFGGVGNVNSNFMSELLGPNGIVMPTPESRQTGRTVPGNVKEIQLISRKLENKDNVDLLK